MAQTRKAKEIRSWIIDVYYKYHDLLIYTRNQLIDQSKNMKKNNHLEIYHQRQIDKYDDYKRNKQREIKDLKEETRILKEQNTQLKKDLVTATTNTIKYKDLYVDIMYEIKEWKQLVKINKIQKNKYNAYKLIY